MGELRRLMPVQNRSAARNIARVCREVLAESPASERRAAPAPRFAWPEAESP
jgi:hypothetical protein